MAAPLTASTTAVSREASVTTETRISDFSSIALTLASPEQILAWSHGEVTKPETINYRTAKPERDGLFDERIFGPTKDYECYCGKYRRIRYKGIVCDKCGVEVTRAIVRRERMGHIQLAAPVSHIWFLRGVPSKIGMILDMSVNDLEKVVYFAGYIVTQVHEDKRKRAMEEIEREFKLKSQNAAGSELEKLKTAKERAKDELRNLRPLRVLSEVEYHRLALKYADVFEAGIGAETLRNILSSVDLEKLAANLEAELDSAPPLLQKKHLKRLKVVRAMLSTKLRPEWMFLSTLPVIPPDLRPMVPLDGGRYASSDLNDLYRRVINRNNRLKRLFELRAPEVITRNEKRMLQEAVDALIDNAARRGQAAVSSQVQRRPLKSLADILKGKQGRFRQNLLGKRVDYSGRSVIVVGPSLNLHQCGLPKEMALELFKPFVIRKLIERELAHNIRGAGRLIDDRPPEVWALLEEVIAEGRLVLLNRAPTLHRLGIQAFQPVLIEGFAIQIHPMVCPPFNADFDGDQMAVHVPLTDEAQTESREIMLSAVNLLKPANGEPIVQPTKDMILGSYWATTFEPGVAGEGMTFADEKDAVMAYEHGAADIRAQIKVRLTEKKPAGAENEKFFETCVGRILFNRNLPADYPFINQPIKFGDMQDIVSDLIQRYGIPKVPPVLDALKNFGFQFATTSGTSWGMDDLRTPTEKQQWIKEASVEIAQIEDYFRRGLLTDRERYDRVVEVWRGVMEKVKVAVPKALEPTGPVSVMITSKARGSWFQTTQMSGMKGLVVNPSGKIIELPVLSSYKEGLNVLEYFISTHGARKGTADTALKTAVAGYLTRRLVDVSQDVIICEQDCGTKKGLQMHRNDSVEIGRPFGLRLFGRVVQADVVAPDGTVLVKAGQTVSRQAAEAIEQSAVQVATIRSAIACRSLGGICATCYGMDLGREEPVKLGEAVGTVAAQSIGEPGTQLTMRTFHQGGVAGGGDITTGLPRVEEIFEVRAPKGQAVIADVHGSVVAIDEANREKIVKVQVESTLNDLAPKKTKSTKRGKKAEVTEGSIKEFRIPPATGLFVEVGSTVTPGDLLCEGHADLKEMFKVAGSELTQRYIIKEVQKIYSLQGAPIHDKHIEIIVRQMFSRVRIKDGGDTPFTGGEVVEKSRFREESRKAIRAGKRPATAAQLLLGITKVALTTSSFLSAASFQETARVLINAAIEGRDDELRGLKENVIIGRLIPAGTGFRKNAAAKGRSAE
ncbi:DNA-directed RNA polymerase subunit beta' [Candidatus Parcubacteria bacterium]|nr:MAG: DNA-directed RNA polymerase subunit beta' [Candidatus Parcubacteria bacterium]